MNRPLKYDAKRLDKSNADLYDVNSSPSQSPPQKKKAKAAGLKPAIKKPIAPKPDPYRQAAAKAA